MSFDRDVTIGFNADIAGYSASMGQLINQSQQYTAAADGMLGAVGKLNNVINAGVKQMSALSGTNKVATAQAAAYQQQMSKIETSAKVTNKNFGELEKTTRGLAKAFPVGMGNAVKQVEALQESGVTTNKEIAKLATTFTKLGAATGTFGPEMTKDMIQLTRTFGNANSQMDSFADSLTTVTSKYGASAGAVVNFSKAIAPIASTVGMSQTSVMGLSTAFSRLGEDGYGAANAFNKVMVDMNRSIREGSPEMKAYAEVMGTSVEQLKRTWASNPTEGFMQFVEAIGKQGPDAIRSLEMLGFEGIRTQKSLTALASSGNVRDIIGDAQKAYGSGSTGVGAETAFGGVNDQLTKLNETMAQTTATAGKPFLGFLEEVLGVANKLSGALSTLVDSPVMQGMAKILGGAGAAFTVAKTLTAWAGTAAFAQNAGRGVIGSASAQRFALGRETGMAPAGSPMAMRAGAAFSSYFGPGVPGPWYAGPRASVGRGINAAGNLFSSLAMLNANEIRKAQGLDIITTEQGRNMRGLASQARSIAADRGIPMAERASIVRAISGQISSEISTAVNAPGGVGRAAMASGTSFGMAARYAGGGLRTLAGGAGSLAMGALGGPAGLALAGAGAAAYGGYQLYRQNQQMDAAAESGRSNAYRAFNEFAEKAGLASRGLVTFAQALSESALKVAGESGNLTQAFAVTSKEIATASTPGFEQAYTARQNAGIKEFFSNRSEDMGKEALRVRGMLGQNASPEAFNRIQMDILAQFGADAAKTFSAEYEKFAKMTSEDIEARLREESKGIPTKEKSEFREFAEAELTRRRSRENEIFGTETVMLANLADAGRMFADVKAGAEYGGTTGKSAPAWNQSQQALMLDKIGKTLSLTADQQADFVATFNRTGGVGVDFSEALRKAGLGDAATLYEQKLAEGMEKSGLTGAQIRSGAVSENEKQARTAASQFAGLGYDAGTLGKDISDLSKVVREGGTQTFQEWVDSGKKGASDLQKALADLKSGGAGNPDAQRAFANAVVRSVGRTQGIGTRGSESEIIAAMLNSTGEEMPGLQQALARAQRNTAMADIGRGSFNVTRDQIVTGEAARRALNTPGAVKTEEQRAALTAQADTSDQAQMQQKQQMVDFVKQMEQMRVGLARQTEDYNTSVGRMNFQFNQSQAWQAADFYRQRRYAAADFHQAMERAERDFHKNRARAQRDFDKQVVRQSEETAKQMFNPYERIAATQVSDAGVLQQTLLEQNQSVQGQLKGVSTLNKRGLSKDAIDQLRLMDPNQAAQVQRLLSDTAEDPGAIDKLNKLIKDRLKAGAGLATSEYNKQFVNMKKDFGTSMSDMAKDFKTAMADQEKDYAKSMARSLKQFNISQSRAAQQHATALANMEADQKKSQKRAQEDMQRLADYFTKDFADIQKEFLKDLASLPEGMSGVTYKAVKAIFDAQLKAMNEGTNKASETARENARAGGSGGMPDEGEGFSDYAGKGYLDSALGRNVATPGNGWQMRTHPITGRRGFHTGVDFSAAEGSPVYAPFSGTMRTASGGWAGNHVVIVPSGGGPGIGFAHLRGFARGAGAVKKGEKVGAVGSTGSSTGPHLHAEMLKSPYKMYSNAINPYPFLAKGGIVTEHGLFNVGEAGKEAVIPLNRDGAKVMAETMVRYLQSSDALTARVSGYSTPVTNNVYSYDQRTQFSGPVTVEASNPDAMAAAMKARVRRDRLARKQGSAA